MRIKIKKLSMRNFKGIKTLDIQPDGKNLNIYGENATGKTTIYDAFLWLLFGKDSSNRADFTVKTLDESGKEASGLEHEVSADLIVNDKPVSLKKIYKEKWVKKRGSAKKTMDGHTTEYFVDDVPCAKKEYDQKISEWVDEATFKLLTSPTYFNTELHWTKRREVLQEVCGDVSEADVISSDKKLKKLDLEGKSVDDYMKVVKAQIKKVNDELKLIPVRIDEVDQSKTEVSEKEADQVEKRSAEIDSMLDALNEQIAETKSGSTTKLEAKLLDLRKELEETERRANAHIWADISRVKKYIAESEEYFREVERLHQDLLLKKDKAEKNKEYIEEMKVKAEEKLPRLRDEFKKIQGRVFEYEKDDTCPTCGQSLPGNQVETAKKKAFEAFKKRQDIDIQSNIDAGKNLKDRIAVFEEEIAGYVSEIEKSSAELEDSLKNMKVTKEKISKAEKDLSQFKFDLEKTESGDVAKVKEEIDKVTTELDRARMNSEDALSELYKKRDDLVSEKKQLDSTLADFATVQKADKRIEELKEQEKTLTAEYERLQEKLNLCEKFIVAKVNLLEDKINSKFEFARFKMFEEQINGGINETCITLVEGVPYLDANNAAKINIGLDIIQTLSEHFGVQVPIFIDNRESVVSLYNVDTQVISLIVSGTDKKLRIEEVA